MSSSSSFVEAAAAGNHHHTYSRKQKSLGLLCKNFVSMYDRDDVEAVGLDDAAKRLGVERRRIYDIVNVLESVGVLARKAKNQYSWIGYSGIPKALEYLKEAALKERSGLPSESKSHKLEEALRERSSLPTESISVKEDLEDEEDDRYLDQSGDCGEEKPNLLLCKARSATDNRREKSLGLLTENFVKLFLTTEADTISLDEAAKVLLGDVDASQMKTKVRRLYDIANVLSSLDLIEKTHNVDTRKPAFRWLGLNGKRDDSVTAVTIPSSPKQPCKRAFGMDVTNVDLTKRNKLISFVDKKPNKVQNRAEDIKECNLTAQKQLRTSKSYVFGPFSPSKLAESGNDDIKEGKKVRDWETLASSYRPGYHNQALSELFQHYMEAWKRWYVEVAQVCNSR